MVHAPSSIPWAKMGGTAPDPYSGVSWRPLTLWVQPVSASHHWASVLDELTVAAGRFRDAVATGTYEANHQFHLTLTGLCANRELVSLIIDLGGNLPATRLRQWQSVERAQKSADDTSR